VKWLDLVGTDATREIVQQIYDVQDYFYISFALQRSTNNAIYGGKRRILLNYTAL
jgi:hypothetical protein